jgi:thymidylate kinase
MANDGAPPRFIIFEGVDGVGKTSLAHAVAAYYRTHFPERSIFTAAFPGAAPHSLGQFVYRFHHGEAVDGLRAADVDPVALQLLHVAAHVDAIRSHIAPTLADPHGVVILDRFWWSTYAYSRPLLSRDASLAMVEPERVFWRALPPPVAIYLTRQQTLKPDELQQAQHHALAEYYQEIVANERQASTPVHVVANDGSFDALLDTVFALLLGSRRTGNERGT